MQRLVLLPLFCLVSAASAPQVLAATVSGTVSGPDGRPVAGAKIVLHVFSRAYVTGREEEPPVTSSDEKGAWKIDIPETADKDVAKAPKPEEVWGRALIYAPGFAIHHHLITVAPLVVRLEKGTSASGVVVDAKGQPVAGVAVQLRSVFHREGRDFSSYFHIVPEKPLLEAFTSRTDAAGRWVLGDLPSVGDAVFGIRDSRYAQADARAKLGAALVEVTKLTVRPAATLSGRVVGEDGKPIKGARVSASKPNGNSWSSTTTAADGTYKLESLAAGPHNVSARDASEENRWVAEPLPNTVAVEGKVAALPDIVAGPGALITGTITDAATNKPLDRVGVANSKGNNWSYTKADGKYRLRVLPGKAMLYIGGKPQDYLYPETGNPSSQMFLTLAKGEEKTLDWKLPRGLEARGVARGEDNAPAKVALKLTEVDDRGGWSHDQTTTAHADDRGEWKLGGLKPGRYTLAGDDDWEVTAPKEITLPLAAPLEVRVKPLVQQSLAARVVTPEGQPVEKATVRFTVMVPISKNSWTSREEKGETDAQGRFVIGKLRPDYRVSLLATKPGHRFVRGGKAERKDNAWIAEDVVLLPLVGRAEGRVTDTAGQPVVGAKIFSPDGGEEVATSDDTGRFVLSQLPAGEVTLVATHASGAGAKAARAGEANIAWVLRPQSRVTEAQRDAAFAILEDVWETSRGSKWRHRAKMPAEYLSEDPDAALKMALQQAAAAKPEDANARYSLYLLIEKGLESDAARTLEWAPAQLAGITNPYMRLMATVNVGLAAAKENPALAEKLFEQAKALESKDNEGAVYGPALLAALAARLKKEEAVALADKSIAATTRNGELGAVAEVLGQGNAALAERAIAKMQPDKDPRQGDTTHYYVRAIESLAPHDTPGALSLLDKLEKVNGNNAEFAWGQAAVHIIRALGPRDPAAALALARRVESDHSKVTALALAARFQPREDALKILREAAQAVTPHYYNAVGTLAKVAGQAYDLDAAVGKEIFALALDHLPSDTQGEEERRSWRQQSGAGQVALLAFHYARVDPVQARLLLEREWAYQKALPTTERRHNFSDLAVAMAALDPERAKEMAWQAHGDGTDLSAAFDAQVRIARFLMDPKDSAEKLFSEF
jgi:protocatechuate 3,4-dioxygenase beta subunit